jgi:hypothetical protein
MANVMLHTTFDVWVGAEDDHVLFTARQLVTLLPQTRSEVIVAATDSQLTHTVQLTMRWLQTTSDVGVGAVGDQVPLLTQSVSAEQADTLVAVAGRAYWPASHVRNRSAVHTRSTVNDGGEASYGALLLAKHLVRLEHSGHVEQLTLRKPTYSVL